MNPRQDTDFGVELRLVFADGSKRPFVVREMVNALRHKQVITIACVLAVVLAIPQNGSFSDDVPLVARVVLNLCSVALFTLIFPALLWEVASWSQRNKFQFVFEPLITLTAAIITTLAIETLATVLVGHSQKTRLDILTKLAFGCLFWGLHVMTILRFVLPAMIEAPQNVPQNRQAVPPLEPQVQIGRQMFNPKQIDRIAADDHFLTIEGAFGTRRIHAAMGEAADLLQDYGMLVHRGHWVALRELGPIQVVGRGLRMQTKSGASLPVARSRRDQVKAALLDGDLE